MTIRIAVTADTEDLASLRLALWPSQTLDEHRDETTRSLATANGRAIIFVAEDVGDGIVGFVDSSLRHDFVNGCETSPVAFVEGLFVQPKHRGRGFGRALIRAVESWARTRDCSELASDALLDNADGHAFHSAVGFEETERVVYFRKAL